MNVDLRIFRTRIGRIAPLAIVATLLAVSLAHASTPSHGADLMPVLAALCRVRGSCSRGALAFCFGSAYLAGLAGLAPIVGAFAAGLILDEVHYEDLRQRDHAIGLGMIPAAKSA